jgi:hypothetical protein
VTDRGVVAFAEAIPVVATHLRGNMRVAEFVPIVRVRSPVIFEVAARPFDAIMEAALLELAELRRRYIPTTRPLGIPGGRRWWTIPALSQSCA